MHVHHNHGSARTVNSSTCRHIAPRQGRIEQAFGRALQGNVQRQNHVATRHALPLDNRSQSTTAAVGLLDGNACTPLEQSLELPLGAHASNSIAALQLTCGRRRRVFLGGQTQVPDDVRSETSDRISTHGLLDDPHAGIALRMAFNLGHGRECDACEDHMVFELLAYGNRS